MAYTIMVVDDSSIIRCAIERALGMTRLPAEMVLQAQNGKQALELLGKRWVDLVFTDINMPEMTGIELIAAMKAHPEYKDIPVIMISTEGSAQRIAELMAMGINGYLRKPFTPEKLRDVIIQTLGEWNHDDRN
jgi:two-component system chemotaxis response regulator CheY